MGYSQDMATEKYPVGTRIQMIQSRDPVYKVPELMFGKVVSIDEYGDLSVVWDNGARSRVDIARDGIDTA